MDYFRLALRPTVYGLIVVVPTAITDNPILNWREAILQGKRAVAVPGVHPANSYITWSISRFNVTLGQQISIDFL